MRLIDADELIAAITEYGHEIIDKLEAELVEYMPEKQGEWLNFIADFSTAECSLCGSIYEVSPEENPCREYFEVFKQSYRFCPNCGAQMGLSKEKKK